MLALKMSSSFLKVLFWESGDAVGVDLVKRGKVGWEYW
jgi:hypothetical protein